MSTLGWVDFSSDDRKRVNMILALLKEAGTLDELGVGQIRDAYSDLMFPGFSTIQTSAKYFILVPRILQDWCRLRQPERKKTTFERYLHLQEDFLAKILVENHKRMKIPPNGIIGHTMIDKGGVVRRPSEIYWNGLRQFGIVRTNLSMTEYFREWQTISVGNVLVQSDEGADDDIGSYRGNHLRCSPDNGSPWLDNVTLRLTSTEAQFLKDQITFTPAQANSVTKQLLQRKLLSEGFIDNCPSFAAFHDWAISKKTISDTCRNLIWNAQQFSLAIEGAHIRYNHIIACRTKNTRLRKASDSNFDEWLARIRRGKVFHEDAPREWITECGNQGIKSITVRFLNRWNDAMSAQKVDANLLDKIVEEQAKENKPGRSLLFKLPSPTSDWVGMRELDYRWGTVRGMLKEIQKGLSC